MTTLSWFTENP